MLIFKEFNPTKIYQIKFLCGISTTKSGDGYKFKENEAEIQHSSGVTWTTKAAKKVCAHPQLTSHPLIQ